MFKTFLFSNGHLDAQLHVSELYKWKFWLNLKLFPLVLCESTRVTYKLLCLHAS